MLREGQADLQKSTRPEVLNLPDALDACDEIYPGYSARWFPALSSVHQKNDAFVRCRRHTDKARCGKSAARLIFSRVYLNTHDVTGSEGFFR